MPGLLPCRGLAPFSGRVIFRCTQSKENAYVFLVCMCARVRVRVRPRARVRVCVCLLFSFLPPRASRRRSIGTYVFNVPRKNFYNRDFRFVQKLRRHLLASNATNYTWAPKDGYQRNQRKFGKTLIVAI